ncbi:MAG: hypothetical protein EXS13_13565 [Planctomycetes bacterium]|nr:hypothetical protein [Planctomycetota bacterium]
MAIRSLLLAFVSITQNTVVHLVRAPDDALQPQVAADASGTLHLVTFRGEPTGGDLYYARSSDCGATFTPPIRVNRDDGDAMAIGNIRGAQLALGKSRDGSTTVHVAWMGAAKSRVRGPKNATPMLYSRLVDGLAAFEPERNVITTHPGLDGGGTLAADDSGHVWVAWQAPLVPPGPRTSDEGEAKRTVWIAASSDGGAKFAAETRAWNEPTGACACCGMRAFAADGELVVLYRAAAKGVDRDLYALVSRDLGKSFVGSRADEWRANQCVMSTSAAAAAPGGVVVAWEDEGEVAWAKVGGGTLPSNAADGAKLGKAIRPPVAKSDAATLGTRKHPSIAVNAMGEVLLAWTEGMGWERGGSLAWQLFTADGKPIEGASGRADGVPAWSLVSAAARSDGSFVIVY